MALGDIAEIVDKASKLAGGKPKKSPVEKELDNFGKQILDTEAKWRIASLSTLKGLNRFISAVNKAAETVERLKGLRAEAGGEGPSMKGDLQRRYASLISRRKMAERAIAEEKLDKDLAYYKARALTEQIKNAKREAQLSASKKIAYGPSYLASQKLTAGPATAESFVMQRKGRAVPIAADYISSRVSPIRQPGTNVVPAGGIRSLVPEYAGRELVPRYSGNVPQTEGVGVYGYSGGPGGPGSGYYGMPHYGVPQPGGAYAKYTYYGGKGGGGLGALLGAGAGTAWDLAKWGYNATTNAVAQHRDEFEDLYRASRTGGAGSYGGYLSNLSPTGEARSYSIEPGLAAMGFDIHRAAQFQNRYASPFRAKTAMGVAGGLSMGAITGNIPVEDWADLMRKELSMGMLSGKTGMEQFKKTMTDAMIAANIHTLPPPEVMENVERYLSVMAGSSAIRGPGEVARMAGAAGGYALPNWRNFSVQAQALSAYQSQLENLPGNPLRLMETVVAATNFNGGKTPLMSPDKLEKFVAAYGGGDIHFNKKQREGIEEAIKMGGMIGFNAETTMAMMAGAKPEFLKNIGLGLFTSGLGAKKGSYMPAYLEYMTGGAGPGGVLGPWAAGAAGTAGGGAYPAGMSSAAAALADKLNININPATGKPYGDELRYDAPVLAKFRELGETGAATTMAGAAATVNTLEPTVNDVKSSLDRLIGAFDYARDQFMMGWHGGASPATPAPGGLGGGPRHMGHGVFAAPEAPGSSGAPPGILGPGSVSRPAGSPAGASTRTTAAVPGSS